MFKRRLLKIILNILFLSLFIQKNAFGYDTGAYTIDGRVSAGTPVHQYITKESIKLWWNDMPSIAQEEFALYSGRGIYDQIDSIGSVDYDAYWLLWMKADDLVSGSAEEDSVVELYQVVENCTNDALNGFFEHFWDPDIPWEGKFNCGNIGGWYNFGLPFPEISNPDLYVDRSYSQLYFNENKTFRHYDSAYRLAQYYWDLKIIPYYKSGDYRQTYYWLGRIAHLLQDMTVPAHVHTRYHDPFVNGDSDLFEVYASNNIFSYKGDQYSGKYYKYENLINNFSWDTVHDQSDPPDLFKLFWYTTQKTQYFASASAQGGGLINWVVGNSYYRPWQNPFVSQAFTSSLWEGENATIIGDPNQIEANLSNIADALIPHALKATAGLFRLFWDTTHPGGSYTNLSHGATVGDLVLLKGTASSPEGVDYVNFTINYGGSKCGTPKISTTDSWQLLYKDSSVPYEYTLDLSGKNEGWFELGLDIYAKNSFVSYSPSGTICLYHKPSNSLNVSITGNGTVNLSPPGSNCTTNCSQSYDNGTPVTLTATANIGAGYYFVGWSGDCTGNSSTCPINMDTNKNVGAIFVLSSVKPTSISVTINLNPSTTTPYSAVNVSGKATYNTGSPVTSGTAIIDVLGFSTYTAPLDSSGNYSRDITAPDSSRYIYVTVTDGILAAAENQAFLTITGGTTNNLYTFDRSTTSKDMQTDDPWNPINETDFFRSSDSGVYVWFRLTDIFLNNHNGSYIQPRFEWYRPNGSLYASSDGNRINDPGYGSYYLSLQFWSYLPISGYDVSDTEGRWSVKIYIFNGNAWEYKATESFIIRYEFAEHKMAYGVQSTDPWEPIYPTNIFYTTYARAYTWARANNVTEGFDVKWEWYEPNDSLYKTSYYTAIDPKTSGYDYWGWYKFWDNIDINGASAGNKAGDWLVKFYIKDPFGNWDLEYTDNFKIIEDPSTKPSVVVTQSPSSPTNQDSLTLNVIAGDNTYIKRVILYWNDGTLRSQTWDNIFSSSFTRFQNIGTYPEGTTIEFYAVAYDTSNNMQESERRSVAIKPDTTSLWLEVHGNGMVTLSPPGFDCITNCSQSYLRGTLVTLLPQPNNGWTFSGWSGDSDCWDGQVKMDIDKTCAANFSTIQHNLSVSITGSGTVTDSASGINCSTGNAGICGASLPEGIQIILAVNPETGYTFNSWGGDCLGAGTSTTCSLTIDSDKSVSATLVQLIAGEPIQLPRTGQTTCYDSMGAEIPCADTGQDGDIQAGVPWPNHRFADKGDGTITDNLTGLMWTKDANLMASKDPGFDVDNTTGDGKVTWQHALDYVKKLNTEAYLDYTDWRLPNILELESLVNAGEPDTSIWFNTQGFNNVQSIHYWSSTTQAYYAKMAWVVDVPYGHMDDRGKSYDFYVWPVRSGQSGVIQIPKTGQTDCYDTIGTVIACAGTGQDGDIQAGNTWPSPRFIDNGNSTVTDNLTGLMWTKDTNLPGGYKSWQEALDYVTGMNAGIYSNFGSTDWRLPNRKELYSLVDFSRYNPAIPLGHPFLNVEWGGISYWSSTTYINYPIYKWYVFMMNGGVFAFDNATFRVWPVRGGQSRIDSTPPTTPLVTDSGVYTTDGTGLYARWQSHDPESGVVQYKYCVGTAPGSCDVVDWTPIGDMTEGSLPASGLIQGTEYFINIRASNTVNLISPAGSSNGITFLNPDEDPDVDNYSNGTEVAAKSDPRNPDSIPGTTTLNLRKDFNLVSFPAETLYYENILNLMTEMGGCNVISRILIFNPVSQIFTDVGYDDICQPYGQNLSLPSGQGLIGLIIYAKQVASLTFTSQYCPTWNLRAGTNLVGTPCAAPGLTAFQLLRAIGSDAVASSVQRHNSDTGEFETAAYHYSVPAGVDFSIKPGEGYFITMHQAVSNIRTEAMNPPDNQWGECVTDTDCIITGCSGQICASEPVITTCEWREEYACYHDPLITTCGCNMGTCGWAKTPELALCIEQASGP